MAQYPDYAPKKKKFRLFDAPEATPEIGTQEDEEKAPEVPAAEEPRFCLRCTDTKMLFYRTVKLQMEGCRPGTIVELLRDDDDPDDTALLPAEIWVCPKCRRMEQVWGFPALPRQRRTSPVVKHERAFENCTEQQLRQVLQGEEFNADMKQAARNLLRRNYDCWK